MSAPKLIICHLYPELLNLYGDRGNVLCLVRRLQWRGIEWELRSLRVGERPRLDDVDLFFAGGGQDFEQTVLMEDLDRGAARELQAAAADGRTMLGICGGYQLLGYDYETADGTRLAYLGVADFRTVAGPTRLVGDLVFDVDGTPVVGFENHGGRTYLGPGARPLGRVLRGGGNNGEDGTEGVHAGNIFGTYAHGPVLPKNPALADAVLESALVRKYGAFALEPLDDGAEAAARREAMDRARVRGKVDSLR